MKKNILYTMMVALAVTLLASCDKDSEGLSKIIDYPALTITGDVFYISPIGQTYVDEGCTATYQGADYTSHIIAEGIEDIDVNTPGLYYVTYSATSPDGFTWSETRTVAVCDPSVTTDLSGTWTTTENTYRLNSNTNGKIGYSECTTEIKYLCPGIFEIQDYMAGFYSQYAGYQAAYPSYDFDLDGIFQLTADNKIVAISSNPLTIFNPAIAVESIQDGEYDPATGVISFVMYQQNTYMQYHVELKK